MKTKVTCATCKDNGCDIRKSCPDDETSTERRPTVLTEVI